MQVYTEPIRARQGEATIMHTIHSYLVDVHRSSPHLFKANHTSLSLTYSVPTTLKAHEVLHFAWGRNFCEIQSCGRRANFMGTEGATHPNEMVNQTPALSLMGTSEHRVDIHQVHPDYGTGVEVTLDNNLGPLIMPCFYFCFVPRKNIGS